MEVGSTRTMLQCVVVTPEKIVLDTPVESVVLPLYDGELGILSGRAPLIGRLGPGELRTRHGNEVQRFFVDGGFAQVRSNVVTVLTPRALLATEIKKNEVEKALEPLPPGTVMTDAQRKARERARAQRRILEKKDSHGHS